MNDQEGPTRTVTYRCTDCVFLRSEYYSAYWGFHRYCDEPSSNGRRIDNDSIYTPVWCPYRSKNTDEIITED